MTGKLAAAMAGVALLFAAPAAAQDSTLVTNIGPEAHAILVTDGIIVFAGAPQDIPDHPRARSVDAGGLYAVPGLIDMHVHVWGKAELAAYLASGVTTVRNMSGMPFHLRMAAAIERGELVGPRLLTTGPILNSPGPNQQINHQLVTSEVEARAAVKAQHDAGYSRIKTYSNLTVEAWRGIRKEVHARGMRLTGHTPEGERLAGIPFERPFRIPFLSVLDAGWETIEHSETIVWHGLADRLDPVAGQELAERIAAAGVPVTPTLVAHRNLVHVAETHGTFAKRAGTEWLNPVTQRTEQPHIAAWAITDPAAEREKARFLSTFTGQMHRAGVLLVAGSDAGIFTNIPGVSLHDELDLLVEAGLTPGEAVASATANAAKALDQEGRLGCLEAGCTADIVFVTCDPHATISCLRHPAAVMHAGRWEGRAGLAALRASASKHDIDGIVRDLVAGMKAQGTPIDPSALGMSS